MWSTAVASILSRPATTSRLDIANHPTLVNAFFLSLPFLLLGTVIPLAQSVNWHFNHAFDLFRILDAELALAEAAFDSGASSGIPPQVPSLLSELTRESGPILSQWRKVWIVWSFFDILFVVVRALLSAPPAGLSLTPPSFSPRSWPLAGSLTSDSCAHRCGLSANRPSQTARQVAVRCASYARPTEVFWRC